MCSAFFARVTYVRLLLIEQGTHRVERVFSSACRLCPICADRTRHKPCVACFSSGGLCPIFAYSARHTPCLARFFLGVSLKSDLC